MIKNSALLDIQSLTEAAECLRLLAHPHRLQIIQLLLFKGDFSVNELAADCNLSQPTTSEHLNLMQRCGFLKKTAEEEGRTVKYSVAEPHLKDLMGCIQRRFS